MDDRRKMFSDVLRQTRNAKEVNDFFSHKLSETDISSLREGTIDVLLRIPPTSFNCALMSALWGAVIMNHSSVPVSVISGHLVWDDKKYFIVGNQFRE